MPKATPGEAIPINWRAQLMAPGMGWRNTATILLVTAFGVSLLPAQQTPTPLLARPPINSSIAALPETAISREPGSLLTNVFSAVRIEPSPGHVHAATGSTGTPPGTHLPPGSAPEKFTTPRDASGRRHWIVWVAVAAGATAIVVWLVRRHSAGNPVEFNCTPGPPPSCIG